MDVYGGPVTHDLLWLFDAVPLCAFVKWQTGVFQWWKPKGRLVETIARKIGFVPMIFWGMGGTPIPFRSPMTVVVGRPITIEKKTKNPSREEVSVWTVVCLQCGGTALQ